MRAKLERIGLGIGIGRGGPCGGHCLGQADKTSLLPCLALKSFVSLRCVARSVLCSTLRKSHWLPHQHSSTGSDYDICRWSFSLVVVVASDSRDGCQTQHKHHNHNHIHMHIHIHERRQVAVKECMQSWQLQRSQIIVMADGALLLALRKVCLPPA